MRKQSSEPQGSHWRVQEEGHLPGVLNPARLKAYFWRSPRQTCIFNLLSTDLKKVLPMQPSPEGFWGFFLLFLDLVGLGFVWSYGSLQFCLHDSTSSALGKLTDAVISLPWYTDIIPPVTSHLWRNRCPDNMSYPTIGRTSQDGWAPNTSPMKLAERSGRGRGSGCVPGKKDNLFFKKPSVVEVRKLKNNGDDGIQWDFCFLHATCRFNVVILL